MSELIEKNEDRAAIRCLLLAGVSALALTTNMTCETALAAEDTDRPTVWIEVGGETQQMQGLSSPFLAPFMGVTPTPAPYVGDPFVGPQHANRISVALDGKLSFQPEGSNWIFSAGIQYGRSNKNKHVHHQTPNQPAEFTFYFAYYHTNYHLSTTFNEQPHADTRALFKESHMVLDFQAGRDVGLGLFGRFGTSTLNGGVRFAQFSNKSSIDIQARPAVNADAIYETLFSGYISFPRLFPNFYQYHLQGTATRNFRGVGPSLSWNASADLLGNPEDGELTVDWGINAALLFGRQKTETSHATEAHHRYFTNPGGYNFQSHYAPIGSNSGHSRRSRSVVVPNVGGFAGFSVKYPNAKFSFGYRIDTFLGAMDTGIDTRQTSNVMFHGPYAALSIGLGG